MLRELVPLPMCQEKILKEVMDNLKREMNLMNQEREEPQKLLSPKAGVNVWKLNNQTIAYPTCTQTGAQDAAISA